MADQRLIAYLREYLSRGYSMDQLKPHLVSQGFAESDIDAAIRVVAHPSHHLTVLVAISLIGMLLIAIVSWYADFSVFESSPSLDTNSLQLESNIFPEVVEAPLSSEKVPLQEVPSEEVEQGAVKQESFCDTKECAEEKFKSCEPTLGVYSSFFVVEVEYRIIGPEGSRCEVEGKVISSPKPALKDLAMTCLLDNALPLEDALKDLSQCVGPLADALAQDFA